VCFTLFSIIGTSILYQEFSVSMVGVCPQYIFLHLFLDGCILTFSGVWLITSNRAPLAPPSEDLLHGDGDADGDEVPGMSHAASLQSVAEDGGMTEVSLVGALPVHDTGEITRRDRSNSIAVRALSITASGVSRTFEADQWDGRSSREARTSSRLSLLGALGGGQMATFAYDPAEHQREDDVINRSRRASSMAPRRTSAYSSHPQPPLSARGRPSSSSIDQGHRPSSASVDQGEYLTASGSSSTRPQNHAAI